MSALAAATSSSPPSLIVPPSALPPTAVRPLTGVEDLIVFYHLTRSYRKYAQSSLPSTFEHLIANVPGPSLYTSSPSSPTALVPVTSKETLLMPLSYQAMPPPLQVRPLNDEHIRGVLAMREVGELGLVGAEMREKEERVRRLHEEERARREEKKSKKTDKRKRKTSATAADDAVKRVSACSASPHPTSLEGRAQSTHPPLSLWSVSCAAAVCR